MASDAVDANTIHLNNFASRSPARNAWRSSGSFGLQISGGIRYMCLLYYSTWWVVPYVKKGLSPRVRTLIETESKSTYQVLVYNMYLLYVVCALHDSSTFVLTIGIFPSLRDLRAVLIQGICQQKYGVQTVPVYREATIRYTLETSESARQSAATGTRNEHSAVYACIHEYSVQSRRFFGKYVYRVLAYG